MIKIGPHLDTIFHVWLEINMVQKFNKTLCIQAFEHLVFITPKKPLLSQQTYHTDHPISIHYQSGSSGCQYQCSFQCTSLYTVLNYSNHFLLHYSKTDKSLQRNSAFCLVFITFQTFAYSVNSLIELFISSGISFMY